MKKPKEITKEELERAAHVSAALGTLVQSMMHLGVPYSAIGLGIVVFVREECQSNIEGFIDMLRDCDDSVRLAEVKPQ